ncbi:MAG: hypothetical protein MUO62_12285 [Anaerolineales bacterium]|nr:hypothetical protein [Anaerolineales bacterium]
MVAPSKGVLCWEPRSGRGFGMNDVTRIGRLLLIQVGPRTGVVFPGFPQLRGFSLRVYGVYFTRFMREIGLNWDIGRE